MTDESRRSLLAAASAFSLASTFSTNAATAAEATRATISGAFIDNQAPKPLAFDSASLDGLSAKLINSHWENNYGGSVRALNVVKQRLQTALADDAAPAYLYNDLKREHLLRTGSVVLHEYYFDNLSPAADREPELDSALARAFGSAATWEKEFKRIGAGLGGGSGWVMLGWNFHAQTLENFWMWDHMHAPVSTVPLLVMDMYEHSYQMDYGAATGQYIDAFMRNINWQVVAMRLVSALEGRI